MAIRVTENWSASMLSLVPPWEAYREFLVTGTSSEPAALVAVDPTTGVKVYQRGDGHPANPTRVRCDGPRVVRWQGPFSVVVGCHFSLDTGNFTDEDPDPLRLPAKITWTTIRESVAVDHDLDNKAVTNGAGDLYGDSTQNYTYKHLRIVKNFPYYDILLSKQFECAVNDVAVELSGIKVAAQHMCCTTIEPAVQDYPPNAPFLPIAFEWDVYAENVRGKYPFQIRRLNSGHNGWKDDGGVKKAGRFVNGDGEQIDNDVFLGPDGTPLKKRHGTDIKVGTISGGTPGAPVPPPSQAQPFATECYAEDGTLQGAFDRNTTAAVFFYFKGARVVSFGPLLTLF